MNIGIVGGGAIGLLFAAHLAEKYHVTIYTRTEEQAKKLTRKGLMIEKEGTVQHIPSVTACPFEEWAGNEALTIVTVKQYQLNVIINKIASLKHHNDNSLLFLQNGMSHLQLLQNLSDWNIYVGSVEHGALRIAENNVKHTGIGVTRVATYQGSQLHLNDLVNSFNVNFPFIIEADYEQMLLKKLTVNAMINPLTAVLRVKNGELVQNTFYFQVFKSLFEEMNRVLLLEDKAASLEHIIRICRQTANNQSSMLKDILEGRPTEVDAILGYLITRAQERQINTPLIEMFYLLIKGCESNREEH